jgi:hypothetical protein
MLEASTCMSLEGWRGTYSNLTPSGRESPTLRGAIVFNVYELRFEGMR